MNESATPYRSEIAREPMTPARNGIGHAATGTIGALATGALVQHGVDPYLASAGVAIAAGVVGALGAWARDRMKAGSQNPIVYVLALGG